MQFDRFKLLVGDDFLNIQNKTVLILGLGGVGSYVCESLIRSGVSNLIIVDNDKIDITNLNRQLMTNLNNIGRYKTEVWEERIKEINPNCNITIITEFINKDNIDDLFKQKIDYFVDACDTVDTKVLAIKNCIEKNIKIISCMGTGNKMDPSKLKITDISKTNYDKLAKIMRKRLNEIGIKHVTVVSSDEEAYTKIKDAIPSNSFVPSSAGLLITSYIINDIIGDKNV